MPTVTRMASRPTMATEEAPRASETQADACGVRKAACAGAAEPEGPALPRPPRPHGKGREEAGGAWQATILYGLKKPGCLLCRERADAEANYYFWFLNEQYGSPPAIERLQRSRGFCLRHTRHLVLRGAPSQTSYVADYILRACGAWLRSLRIARAGDPPERLYPSVPCPACESERAAVGRFAWALAECLQRREVAEAYRASDGLCFPHFLEVAPLAGWETLADLVAKQIRRMEYTGTAVLESGGTDSRGFSHLAGNLSRLYGSDVDASIRPFLARGGDREEATAIRVSQEDAGQSSRTAAWSSAFEETRRLLRQPGCSLCRVSARGREEYLAWLQHAIGSAPTATHQLEQLRDLCPEHGRLLAARGDREVVAAACAVELGSAVGCLHRLREGLSKRVPATLVDRIRALPSQWRASRLRWLSRVRPTLRTLWMTPHRVLNRVRAQAFWRTGCPLCRHLETLEGRAADRLAIALADPEGRRAFEKSYATCLRHAPLLLERARDPELRTRIVEVLLARVEMDRWEAEEFMRKQSWSVRHEPCGAEQEAWLTATARIVGMVIESRYGL